MNRHSLSDLLDEYDRALAYTATLVADLTDAELTWRADDASSSIAWHLGHQAAVAHYMVRNLTAAEPRIDPAIDAVMDSATQVSDRGELPDVERLMAHRTTVAERVRFRVGNIDDGNVGAPVQLREIATTMLTAIINHEYQHSKWIGEVRVEAHGKSLPPEPNSDRLTMIEGYVLIA